MPSNNQVVLSSAGSGKTTTIVHDACKDASRKAALVTYTVNGTAEIAAGAYRMVGAIPPHIAISTWYTFLLRHFVRPYQNHLYDGPRVYGIKFNNGRSAVYSGADDVPRHYFSRPGLIYIDKVSKFACEVIRRTAGLPIQRLEQIFDRLFIDESQDLAGYDLELIEALMRSRIQVNLVGDHRQATFSTNSSAKNSGFARSKIIGKFTEWESKGLCRVEYHNYSYRCVQAICAFADRFHPHLPATESRNTMTTGHDGVFALRERDIGAYMKAFNPQPLRYNRLAASVFGTPINFGGAKGMTFLRTIIYPHKPLKKFLQTGKLEDAGKDIAKIYVAVTRARQSVAFVVDDGCEPKDVPLFRP